MHFDCAIATQEISRPGVEYQLIFEESFWLPGDRQQRCQCFKMLYKLI
jgi:hypothetical protein